MPTITELFHQAVYLHKGGNLAQAEPLYRQVLQSAPRHAEAHHLLGLLAHQRGHHQIALELIRQALALNPAIQDGHFNLGIVLMHQGQCADASLCFRQTLQREPHHVGAHINLGNAFMNLGQPAEASACYREALRLDPQHPYAPYNLGNALLSLGQWEEGCACYRLALQRDPANATAHYNLGIVLKDHGQPDQAAKCFRQALHYQPLHADALNNLGIILQGQGQFEEAAQCYRQALRIQPNRADASNNLGTVLKEQDRLDEAADCFRLAARLQPKQADAYNNLGLVFKEQGKFSEADQCFEQAVQIDPGNNRALWNRCLSRLLHGDFERGWPDFELRWAQPGMIPRSLQQPAWDGMPLEGKTILVYGEHGLGDTIQFMRFLPLVKNQGAKVVFECQPALVRLFADIQGVDQLIPAGKPLPPYDVHVSLLKLPSIFTTNIDAVPANIPYLFPEPKLVEYWKKECVAFGSPLNVGIAWQGHPNHPRDRQRSVSLALFEKLTRVPNIRLVSLQLLPVAQQLATASFPVLDLGSRFDAKSMADLAAVVVNLDLVVTVDTALAHVAGALGVPVWVALPLVPDWRWLLERSDNPWYPTMKLFRQKNPKDWENIFERITEEVRLL